MYVCMWVFVLFFYIIFHALYALLHCMSWRINFIINLHTSAFIQSENLACMHSKPWTAEWTTNWWQWQVWGQRSWGPGIGKRSIPIKALLCPGLIIELCIGNWLVHTKFDSYQTTCYFSWVKIPKSTNKYHICNVCTLTIVTVIKLLYCSWSNNYGKRYNHDASNNINDRSEQCLSSSELYTVWLSNLVIGHWGQMVFHSLARHKSISELFHQWILPPVNMYEICHHNQHVSPIYFGKYFAHLLFSDHSIFQCTLVCIFFLHEIRVNEMS